MEDDLEYKQGPGLKKNIGLFSATNLVVGVMIGSGIFVSAADTYKDAGSVGLGLIVWVVCGLLSIISALCYAELGTMIRLSGAEYPYLREAFGDCVAFVYSWASVLLIRPATVAIITLGMGSYVTQPFFSDCPSDYPPMTVATKVVAAFAIGIITLVNCVSVKAATHLSNICTVSKLLAIAILSLIGIVQLCRGYVHSFKDFFGETTRDPVDIAFAFYGGLWAYDGWNCLNFITEELKNPSRNLPLALTQGVCLVTVGYFLVNIGYLTVLSLPELKESPAVAYTVANRLLGPMAWIMPVFVILSSFGSAHGTAMTNARLVYASGRDGSMPAVLALVHNKFRTPITAVVLQSFLACLMLVPEASNFSLLLQYFNFAAWLFYGATFAALLWLRYRLPNHDRPYRVFVGFPVVMVIISVFLVVAPFARMPIGSSACLGLILLGVPLYYIFIRYPVLPKSVMARMDQVYLKIGAILNSSMGELEGC